jgi:hypothetical protein
MYEYTGILLGAHPFLHISRIKVKDRGPFKVLYYTPKEGGTWEDP